MTSKRIERNNQGYNLRLKSGVVGVRINSLESSLTDKSRQNCVLLLIYLRSCKMSRSVSENQVSSAPLQRPAEFAKKKNSARHFKNGINNISFFQIPHNSAGNDKPALLAAQRKEILSVNPEKIIGSQRSSNSDQEKMHL